MFNVLILNAKPEQVDRAVVFEGTSQSVLLPGTEGEFEVLDFHKPIISRLKKGLIVVDNLKEYSIRGGIMAMGQQKLIAFVDI